MLILLVSIDLSTDSDCLTRPKLSPAVGLIMLNELCPPDCRLVMCPSSACSARVQLCPVVVLLVSIDLSTDSDCLTRPKLSPAVGLIMLNELCPLAKSLSRNLSKQRLLDSSCKRVSDLLRILYSDLDA